MAIAPMPRPARNGAAAWRRMPTQHAHRFVHWLFDHLAAENIAFKTFYAQSGIDRSSSLIWRSGGYVNLQKFEYALNTLGYQLTIEPINDPVATPSQTEEPPC